MQEYVLALLDCYNQIQAHCKMYLGLAGDAKPAGI